MCTCSSGHLTFEVKLLGKGCYLGSSLICLIAEVTLAHVPDAFLEGTLENMLVSGSYWFPL